MCLTGVDYFSTLGYQPAIAALAAGAISPLATLVLVAVTLLGALPVYRRVAGESPRGEGSIAMLERLLPRWGGKLLVLVLLGFAATDFMITMTLSAADATAHLIENPFAPGFLHGQEVAVTLVLLALLAAVFLRGFKEAIGVAVVLVVVYLGLNVVVIARSLAEAATHPVAVGDWWQTLTTSHGNPLMAVAIALLVFPKLALGLSGFETGVAVMPQVRGGAGDTEANPAGQDPGHPADADHRRRDHELVPGHQQLRHGGPDPRGAVPAGRGGERPGAGVPGPLTTWGRVRHGVRPEHHRHPVVRRCLRDGGAAEPGAPVPAAVRHGTGVGQGSPAAGAGVHASGFVVTWLFEADVDAQGGAYATGVLVLMTSAAVAVTLSARRQQQRKRTVGFGVIAVLFVYTTVTNIFERPEGIRIAGFFILGIISISLLSRVLRSFELHATHVRLDTAGPGVHGAQHWPGPSASSPTNRSASPRRRTGRSWRPPPRQATSRQTARPLFLEVIVDDSSDFETALEVRGVVRHGFAGAGSARAGGAQHHRLRAPAHP